MSCRRRNVLRDSFEETTRFGGSTPRFGKVGSIYKKNVSSSVSSPAPLPRSDFDIVKSTGSGVSSRKDSSR